MAHVIFFFLLDQADGDFIKTIHSQASSRHLVASSCPETVFMAMFITLLFHASKTELEAKLLRTLL